MKVIYEGYALIPRYEIKADSIPVQRIYSSFDEAKENIKYALKTVVIKKVTAIVEDIDTPEDEDNML